ncbi:MAG: type II secretion system protein [Armatimonadetes bacterium]|nr:type II secretion system protein [Armatimonadota bacterium]
MVSKGFTLMEIVVSIAIIATLAAVIFPAFAQARIRAQQSACASNLRQLSSAVLQYAADHEGMLPLTSHSSRSSSWGTTLMPYGALQALRVCPSDPLASARRAQGGTSYAWNENLLGEFAGSHDAGGDSEVTYEPAVGVERLSKPAHTLLLLEQSAASGTDSRGDHIHNRAWQRFPGKLLEMLQSDLALTRHSGGFLTVCADGHLHRFPPGQLEAQARQGHDPLQIPL